MSHPNTDPDYTGPGALGTLIRPVLLLLVLITMALAAAGWLHYPTATHFEGPESKPAAVAGDVAPPTN